MLVEDGHAGRTYTFAGPEALTTVAQVDAIGTAIGATVRFDQLDPAEARAEWISNGLSGDVRRLDLHHVGGIRA